MSKVIPIRPKLSISQEEADQALREIEGRREQQRPQRRERLTETFARIPHDRALDLYRYRVSGAAWIVLVELDRLILKDFQNRNPVKFSSARLRKLGLTNRVRHDAFEELEAAGVVRVERLGRGICPRVTHLWWPRRD